MKIPFGLLTALALVFTMTASRAEVVAEVVVEAWVDGPLLLHVRPDSITWENLGNSKPGRRDGLDEPTYVNGVEWKPRWHTKDPGGADKSYPYAVQLGTGELEVELISATKQRGEGKPEPRQLTGKMEGGHFVVRIPDSEPGARWYKFVLRKKK